MGGSRTTSNQTVAVRSSQRPVRPTAKAMGNTAALTQRQKRVPRSVRDLLFFAQTPRNFASSDSVADTKTVERLRRYENAVINSKSTPLEIAVKMFGKEAVAKFIDKRSAVRYMFAPSDNPGQCKRSGLPDPDSKEGANLLCWLCGFSLKDPSGKNYDTIVCEHVLPVFQGAMFADIALSKKLTTATPELIKAEYDWSHESCNGPKSNHVFIREIRDNAGALVGWEEDKEVIANILNLTIPKIRSKGIDNGTLSTEVARKSWITKQTDAIIKRLKPIITHLNNPTPDSARMMALLAITKLGDPERWASNAQLDPVAYNTYVENTLGKELPLVEFQMAGRRRKRNRKTRRIRKH